MILTKRDRSKKKIDRVGFNHMLSDVTEKARRNLLLFSSICIFLAVTGELPSQIPLFGIDLDGAKNAAITAKSIACVQFYFLFRFLVLVSVEIKNWLHNYVVSLSDENWAESTYELKSDIQRTVLEQFRIAGLFSKLAFFCRLIETLFPAVFGIMGLIYAVKLAIEFA